MKLKRKNPYSRIALSFAMLVALTCFGSTAARADSGDPSERVARLGSLAGTVSIQPSGVNDWSEATSNYPIATGDRVYTDQDGRAEVQIGQTIARMWHGTDLTVTNLADNAIQLGLAQGTIRLRTYGLDRDEQIEIDTPNGALTVIRPGDIRVDSYTGDGGTVVTVNSGEVELSGPSLSQRIDAGQSVQLLGSNPIQVAALDMPALDELDSWSIERDHHLQRSTSARYVSRDAPGYEDLDDYGDWTPQSDYGPVWYPRNVQAGWVPYRYGHWVWTGPWGWTWVENEPWGYAPFHYGRWANIDNRWGWIPGPVQVRPIWSPALVAFVGGPRFGVGIGGGGGVSAWFPLGPGEPYSPWYHCSPRYVNQVNITNIHVTRIVNIQNNYNTVNVTNINYIHRTGATTAVPAQAFRSARPVATNMIRVDAHQLGQAQIIPHPDIKPTMQSMIARPVRVQVAASRPTLLTQGGRQAAAVPGARPTTVPYRPLAPNAMQHAESQHPVNAANPAAIQHPGTVQAPARGTFNNGGNQPATNNQPVGRTVPIPPSGSQGGHPPSPPNQGNRAVAPVTNQAAPLAPRPAFPQQSAQSPAQRSAPAPAPQAPLRPTYGQGNPVQNQPLINRNETPAPRPTFQQQQPAMNQHPGRPLEPQQMDNIHQGRPAGPARDQELIPHPQPQPRYTPPPQQQRVAPAPQRQASPPPPPQQQRLAPAPQRQAAPPARPPAEEKRQPAANDHHEHN